MWSQDFLWACHCEGNARSNLVHPGSRLSPVPSRASRDFTPRNNMFISTNGPKAQQGVQSSYCVSRPSYKEENPAEALSRFPFLSARLSSLLMMSFFSVHHINEVIGLEVFYRVVARIELISQRNSEVSLDEFGLVLRIQNNVVRSGNFGKKS